MQNDPITVFHDGKEWEVVGGRLVPFTEVIIDAPRTAGELNARMVAALPAMRRSIITHISENSPYFKDFA